MPQVNVHVTRQHKRAIKAAAKAAGLSISDWARRQLWQAAAPIYGLDIDATPRVDKRVRLSDAEIAEIREACANGAQQKDVAAQHGVSRPTVHRIVKGTLRVERKPRLTPRVDSLAADRIANRRA